MTSNGRANARRRRAACRFATIRIDVPRPGAAGTSRVLLGTQVTLVVEPFGTRAALVVIAVGGRAGRRNGRWRSRPGGRRRRARPGIAFANTGAPGAAHGGVSHERSGMSPSLKQSMDIEFRSESRVSK
jgi:hypothetical protein